MSPDDSPAAAGPPEQSVVLDIESGIAQLFRSARQAIRLYSAEVHPDLQPTGFSILRHIAQNGPSQASSIVAVTGLDKSAVSRQLSTLRMLGLVTTRPDPNDGRSSYLVMTPLAEERLAAVRAMVTRDYAERFETWSPAELATFASLLGRFNGAAGGR
ncbi:MarR family winged helix-turn-helix transcriptional regulator [Subtercola sp. Z020]|uniref:MarR family winged helix-turn-helix transcriptional regulator n=1 Tax=Subtercola sp. Z020 TaxID=2080582 RepID=UPI00130D943A|nr:MarR family winged helix-turn-helix transcriptional regulator [Subtercola sp. Z020]